MRYQNIIASLSNENGIKGALGIAVGNKQNVQWKNILLSKSLSNGTALTRYWTSSTNPTGTIQCQNGYIQWKWINNNNPLHCNTNTANCSEPYIDVSDIYSMNKNCSGLIEFTFYSYGTGVAFVNITESLPSPETPYSLLILTDRSSAIRSATITIPFDELLHEVFNPKSTLYVNTEGLYTDNDNELVIINIKAEVNSEIKTLGAIGLVISLAILIISILILTAFIVWYYRNRVRSFTVGCYYNAMS